MIPTYKAKIDRGSHISHISQISKRLCPSVGRLPGWSVTHMTNSQNRRIIHKTRPDTQPIPVGDRWAGAEMLVLTFSTSMTLDQQKDPRTDKASYRVASPRLKTFIHIFLISKAHMLAITWPCSGRIQPTAT